MSSVLPAEGDLRRVIGDGAAIPDGEVDGLSHDDLLALYRNLVLLRTYDERSVIYHRQGRIGTYAIFWNHEAMQAGSVFALEDRDWIFPALPRVGDRAASRHAGFDRALVVAGTSDGLVEPTGATTSRRSASRSRRRSRTPSASHGARGLKGEDRVALDVASATARPPRVPFHEARRSPAS